MDAEALNCSKPILLSVVVPVFRNADTLAVLAESVHQTGNTIKVGVELIFVDDASPDNSGSVLARLEAQQPGVRVIRHVFNKGQQESIRTGLKHACGSIIVVLDADLQDPPELIPKLYRELNTQGTDALFAVRNNQYQQGLRMITSRLFKWIVYLIVGLPRGAGCFVIMTRQMKDRVLGFNTQRFYLPGLICKTGMPIAVLPFLRPEREKGQSAYNTLLRLKVALSNLQCLMERDVTHASKRSGI